MQELVDNERPQPKIRDRGIRKIKKNANKLKKLKVVYVKVNELNPNSYNPNRQNDFDFDLLIRSITEDGFTQPVVALKNNTIVDGEHRWRAAIKLGIDKIPVVHVEMTPEQMRIATLRHNRARGSEDVGLSKEVMADLAKLGALGWAKDSLLMSEKEINDMLSDLSAAEGLADEDYGEAWVPVSNLTNTDSAKKVDITPNVAIASSVRVAEAIQATENKIKDTKDDDVKQILRKETQARIFRIAVSFYGEEADDVKAVLGDKPAENLLKLVKSIQSDESSDEQSDEQPPSELNQEEVQSE